MKSQRLERRTGKSNLLEGIAGTRQHGSDIPPQVPTTRESATNPQEGVRQTQPQAPKMPPGFSKTARDSDKTAWGFHKTARGSDKTARGFHKTARGFYHSQPDLPGSSEPLPASSRRFQAAAWITECSCLQPEGLADGSVRMLPASFEVGQTGFDLLPHIDLIHQIVPTRRVRQFTNQSGGRRLDVGSRNFDGRHDPSTPTCAQSSSKTFSRPHLLSASRAVAQRRVVR